MKQTPSIAMIMALIVCSGISNQASAADKPGSADDDATVLKFFIAEPGKAIPPEFQEMPESSVFKEQIAKYRKNTPVPEDHRLKIGIKRFYQMEVGFHNMIAVITPIDAKDRPDGLESSYEEYVGLIRTVEYKDGLKDGYERTYTPHWPDRPLALEISWKAGKVNGSRKRFFRSGKLMNESTYVDGIEEGESRSYDEAGVLTRKYVAKAGNREGDMIDYWPGSDKPKRVVPYKAGKIEGDVKEYYLEGAVKNQIPFKNDLCHGIAKEYAPDGKVLKTTYWFKGDKVTQEEFEKKSK